MGKSTVIKCLPECILHPISMWSRSHLLQEHVYDMLREEPKHNAMIRVVREEWYWTMNGRRMDESKCNDCVWNFQLFLLVQILPDPSRSFRILISFHIRASCSLSTWRHTFHGQQTVRWGRCSLLVQHVEKLRPVQHLGRNCSWSFWSCSNLNFTAIEET